MKEYKHLNQETIDILFSSKDDKLFYLEKTEQIKKIEIVK